MKAHVFLILLATITQSAFAQKYGGVDFEPVHGRIRGSSVSLVPDYGQVSVG